MPGLLHTKRKRLREKTRKDFFGVSLARGELLRIGVVGENGRQPSFGLFNGDALAIGIVMDLDETKHA